MQSFADVQCGLSVQHLPAIEIESMTPARFSRERTLTRLVAILPAVLLLASAATATAANNPWMNKLIRKIDGTSVKTFEFEATAAAMLTRPLQFDLTYRELSPGLVVKTFRCVLVEEKGVCTTASQKIYIGVGFGTGQTTESIRFRLRAGQVGGTYVPRGLSYTFGCVAVAAPGGGTSPPTPTPMPNPPANPPGSSDPAKVPATDQNKDAASGALSLDDPCFEHDDIPVGDDDIVDIEEPDDSIDPVDPGDGPIN